jgi:hypothetical protein
VEIAQSRARLRAARSGAPVAPRWSDDALDAGLRTALLEYAAWAPPHEETINVTAGGSRQSVAAIAGLQRVLGVAWPWPADGEGIDLAQAWRGIIVEAGGWVRFVDGSLPQAGDRLLVVYRMRQSIAGLDGAAQTSEEPGDTDLLLYGASAFCATAAPLIAAPSHPAGTGGELATWGMEMYERFKEGLHGLGAPALTAPHWGELGL